MGNLATAFRTMLCEHLSSTSSMRMAMKSGWNLRRNSVPFFKNIFNQSTITSWLLQKPSKSAYILWGRAVPPLKNMAKDHTLSWTMRAVSMELERLCLISGMSGTPRMMKKDPSKNTLTGQLGFDVRNPAWFCAGLMSMHISDCWHTTLCTTRVCDTWICLFCVYIYIYILLWILACVRHFRWKRTILVGKWVRQPLLWPCMDSPNLSTGQRVIQCSPLWNKCRSGFQWLMISFKVYPNWSGCLSMQEWIHISWQHDLYI